MRKFYSVFRLVAILAIIMALFTACGNEAKEPKKDEAKTSETTKAAFPITLKDSTGAEVTLEKQPEKIIPLVPSNTEILYALGAGEKVTAVTDNDTYPEDVKKKEKVGGMEVNIEKIISLQPDLVLAHNMNMFSLKDGIQQLKDAKIPVFVVEDAKSFDQVYTTIETIGKLTGTEAKAADVVKDMKSRLAAVQEKAKAVTTQANVFVEISSQPDIYSAGKGTFMDEMLKVVNAKNVAGNLEGWPKLTEEDAVKLNPDVIITTAGPDTAAGVLARPAWKDVPAVKNKRVYEVNADLTNRPGPRVVEGVEEFAKAIYPDVFK
ncbi:ABC transporter substrate-binding protein [Priestia taiwanensis]|uniref:ABC transporter substrate-binding lipoprotein YvrC n=1 Tax=Priestia taiwanensis TaxID=1347902 RepID=A0A917AJF2_9BACI|nr:ABC transporter substrate-binding protein [Priestia taiwanensis]MBM7361588.1 iron complex transport system substrate-binding protein [Priestia taiwanensis]GGE55333.1 putative ABC transporter substrate-binding lipoprotein YvrC [Priestia taiwanensis]